MSAAETPAYAWNAVPWKKIHKSVFKLQKRIYQARQRGDRSTVRKLQRLLMKSQSAKLLAVRRVTQDNRGKNTAGVDGVKSLTPPQRLELARTLKLTDKAHPTRRVWIPKSSGKEYRPLGIPVMRDRAAQALLKLALEPEWEAVFEPNSYGFRPGRSAQDAIQQIWIVIGKNENFVLDTGISKCFDRISHEKLLQKLATSPSLKRAIKAWLKAGVLDGKSLFPTEEGTPQGGVISPLLANIALHGLETAITSAFPERKRTDNGQERWGPHVIRYADDFVVLHRDRQVIEKCKMIASSWLADLGLELHPTKTRVTHTFDEGKSDGKPGFDFLGFHIRQYGAGKHQSGRDMRGGKLQFKALIMPSKEAVKRHRSQLFGIIGRHNAAPQEALINHLNPVVRGWTNYYSKQVSSDTFAKLDHDVYTRLMQWAARRHPNKNQYWVAARYWRLSGQRRWDFVTKDGNKLINHSETPIRRHIKVREGASPFDGNLLYWAQRGTGRSDIPTRLKGALKKQSGRCAECGLIFLSDDLIELDHIIARAYGGKDVQTNLQALHQHCHDVKSARERARTGIDDNDHDTEEPCEAKVSCTVL